MLFPEVNKENINELTLCELDSMQMRLNVEILCLKQEHKEISKGRMSMWLASNQYIKVVEQELKMVEDELINRFLLGDLE